MKNYMFSQYLKEFTKGELWLDDEILFKYIY